MAGQGGEREGGEVNTKQTPGANMGSVESPVKGDGNSPAHPKFFLGAFLLLCSAGALLINL